MISKAELGQQSVVRFVEWISERERANDWSAYIRAGKINRSEVAKECEFGRAAWQQNDRLATALNDLEVSLEKRGLIPARVSDLSDETAATFGAADDRANRAMAAQGSLQKRIKMLEEQNAALKAENHDLAQRLRRSVFAEQHLAEHGRMLPT